MLLLLSVSRKRANKSYSKQNLKLTMNDIIITTDDLDILRDICLLFWLVYQLVPIGSVHINHDTSQRAFICNAHNS